MKIVYIVSNVYKSGYFESLTNYMKQFFQIEYILLDDSSKSSPFEEFLKQNNIPCHRIHLTNSKLGWLYKVFQISRILKKQRPQILHCHLLEAGVIGVLSGRLAGIKTRMYTRHYSDFHHVFFPKGIYYDKLINRLSTHIGSVSHIVSELLIQKEEVQPEKIIYTPNFFDLSLYGNISKEETISLKKKYQIPNDVYVIGVVSRFTHLKGVDYIVDAFIQYVNNYDNKACLCLLNANGECKEDIQNKLKQIPSDNYRIIEFENNMPAMYSLFNVFIHVPIGKYHEAFGQVYIEAMASKTPSIVTLSGVANDFVKDTKNALVVDYKSSSQIYDRLVYVKEHPEEMQRMTQQALFDVQVFDEIVCAKKLKNDYLKLLK